MPLDGDLLAVLETLYFELTARRELERTFEDTVREIQKLIDQMTEDERRQYLVREPVPQFVSYENERLGAYMKKLSKQAERYRLSGDGLLCPPLRLTGAATTRPVSEPGLAAPAGAADRHSPHRHGLDRRFDERHASAPRGSSRRTPCAAHDRRDARPGGR